MTLGFSAHGVGQGVKIFFLLLIFFDGINFDFDGLEFVFEQQVLFRVDSLFDLRPHG